MQTQDFIPLGIAIIAAAFLIPRITRWARELMTAHKGKISLDLSKGTVCSGERLTGRLTIGIKKPVRGLLNVSLVGKENRPRGGGSSGSRSVEVYRNDQIVEETRDFPSEFSKTYHFEFIPPTATEARRENAVLAELAKQSEGPMGSIMKLTAASNSVFQRRIHWSIESRLDAEGIDLYQKKKLRVDLLD